MNKISEWIIGKRKLSTVSDWKKLIGDFRDQFPYDAVTALIVETFANSLDAAATRIDIEIVGDIYKIMDNGKGMTQNEFEEYHNIASLTKRRGGGIGFAGVGAKIFIDKADYIITETKSREFYGATHWAFYGGSLEWIPISVQYKIKYPTGTYVEIKLKDYEDKKKLTPSFAEKVLRQQYNSILLGYYGRKSVTINGKEIEAYKIPNDDIEKKEKFNFKDGSHYIRGYFIKSKKPLPEDFQGIHIVVYGKKVREEWFKQYPIESEKITGLVLADYLVEILRTSKSDFDRTSMLWKKFYVKMESVLFEWLDKIGARPKPPKIDLTEDRSTRELEKSINEILKMPEFRELTENIFQNLIKRRVAIRSIKGNEMGSLTDGMQKTTGTLGGPGSGERVETEGPEEGKGYREDEKGDEPIERVRRRVRAGIHIGCDNKPNELQEAWVGIDPHTGREGVIINTGHPAWKVADGLSFQGKAEHVRIYHILRTVITTLVEESGVENPKKIIANILDRWFKEYVRV